MKKFHISKKGEPVECHAPPGECPRENYDSIEEAYESIAGNNEIVTTITKQRKINKSESLVDQYKDYTRDFSIDLPESLEKVLDSLEGVGTPLIVGGSIRDVLVGKDNKDYDIEVQGTDIDSITKHMRKNGYSVNEVGKKFGVLKVNGHGAEDVDVSVPRTENKIGAGHRGFEVHMDENMSLEDAVARRDFTFNALMYDHKHKKMIDLVGGEKDLEEKVLRHVSEKFAEDPLRVLRGMQFASRFDLTYAPETAELAKKLRDSYNELSVERVREEWSKFFTKGNHPNAGLQALQDAGWDDMTGHDMKQAIEKVKTQGMLDNLSSINPDKKAMIGSSIIASQMHSVESDTFLRTANIDKKSTARAKMLAEINKSGYIAKQNFTTTESRKHFAKDKGSGVFKFSDLAVYAQASGNKEMANYAKLAEEDGLSEGPVKDFIYGDDLIKIGIKPGPSMRRILDVFREGQYKGYYKNREEALEELHKRNDSKTQE